MAKAKTLNVQKKSVKATPMLKLKKGAPVIAYSPTQELLDEKFIRNALWECLKNNDSEGAMEILSAHLEAASRELASKEALCRRHSLARSTLYHSVKGKNPTLKTIAKLVSAVYAESH
jgi:DNA-binding phage protein